MIQAVSTAEQCRQLDADAIERGVPGIALMETASKAVAEAVYTEWPDTKVLVLCGGGNNGGDGYGAARWLKLWGMEVVVESLATSSTGDAAVMRAAAKAHGVEEAPPGFEPDVVVDAVFGTGLSRAVTGGIAARLQQVIDSAVPVVAVDLPSGMHADTGALLGPVPRAVRTVTFARWKPAFFTAGADRIGRVTVCDIGVHPTEHRTAELMTACSLTLPLRPERSHKNRLGHLAIIAGSARFAGAAHLTCLGALAASPGLITLFAPPEALSRLGNLPPEVMVVSAAAEQALTRADDFDAVAIGPGCDPLEVVVEVPAVLDAGALQPGAVGPRTVRTPHPGEAARILGCTNAEIEADRFGASTAIPGCSVLKGAHSLVHDNGRVAVSPFSTAVLATAGSGDVLTGVIGGLLARGLDPFDAARLGVWIHGSAGVRLERQRREGWRASDIAAACAESFGELS